MRANTHPAWNKQYFKVRRVSQNTVSSRIRRRCCIYSECVKHIAVAAHFQQILPRLVGCTRRLLFLLRCIYNFNCCYAFMLTKLPPYVLFAQSRIASCCSLTVPTIWTQPGRRNLRDMLVHELKNVKWICLVRAKCLVPLIHPHLLWLSHMCSHSCPGAWQPICIKKPPTTNQHPLTFVSSNVGQVPCPKTQRQTGM